MPNDNYLLWLIENTKTTWWHDSADPNELDRGLSYGATGVTTNPVLTYLSLTNNITHWKSRLEKVKKDNIKPEQNAETLMSIVLKQAAKKLEPQYKSTKGKLGYVCAQVNPARAGQRDVMFEMAKRFSSWAPNIAVKLPVTAAGLDVLEECTAVGITVTATVSFTVPQVVSIAERHLRGIMRAKTNGIKPGHCFAVIMIGRLDDYLRDVVQDSGSEISESDIRQSGLAITKRAYKIFMEKKYDAMLIVAALRGNYHMTELAGADLIMSIAPKYQDLLLSGNVPREEHIDKEIHSSVIKKLSTIPEFVRAYEPEGMKPNDFLTYGASQKTLSQFSEVGWKMLENFTYGL
jgi:transaldolase